jgi:phosphatidate phosphatase APP1
LFPELYEFLQKDRFPSAGFALKVVRFRDETLFNLFKPATETKPEQIKAILAAYPQRQFILIGDSGELDPEVYSDFLTEYPQQVQRICIRNITSSSLTDARFSQLEAVKRSLLVLFDSNPGDCLADFSAVAQQKSAMIQQ